MAEGITVAPVRRAASQSTSAARPAGSRARRGSTASTGRGTTPAAPKRSFRLPEVVLGVFLVAGCALGAVLWQRSNDRTTTIVVAARPIDRGSVISADDLRGAQVAGDTDAMISGDRAVSLIGQIAAVDIGVGVPMSDALLGDVAVLGAGEALTSMALEPGEVLPDLAQNDHVRVVVTDAADSAGVSATRLVDAVAVVWSVDASPDGVSSIVTVRGPLSLATDVAAAADVRLTRVEG